MKGKVTYFYKNNMKRNSFFFWLLWTIYFLHFLSNPSYLFETTKCLNVFDSQYSDLHQIKKSSYYLSNSIIMKGKVTYSTIITWNVILSSSYFYEQFKACIFYHIPAIYMKQF